MEKKARAVLVSTAVILAAMLLISWESRPPAPDQVQVGRASVQDIDEELTKIMNIVRVKTVADAIRAVL